MEPKTRAELKSYFVKNAIPTEGNFAELIDSHLNQSDDGVFKSAGEPLSVVAAAGAQKRALRLYSHYPSTTPDWMISLNPSDGSAGSDTTRPGFGVTDGAGQARLFIDTATGSLGVGTNAPQAALDVRGDASIGGSLTVGHDGDDSTLTFEAANNRSAQIGVQDDDHQGFYVSTGGAHRLSVNQNGNVGIGTKLATATLHVEGDLRASGHVMFGDDLNISGCRIVPRSGSVHIPQESWNSAQLGPIWSNFGQDWARAQYFRDSCGVVHLRGVIKYVGPPLDGGPISNPDLMTPPGVVINELLFELPDGYRPAARHIYAAISEKPGGNELHGRIDVGPDGSVVAKYVGGSWVSISGITFRGHG